MKRHIRLSRCILSSANTPANKNNRVKIFRKVKRKENITDQTRIIE